MTDLNADGYGQMPAEQPTGPASRGPAPAPVLTAVKLMFVRAVLGLLSLLTLFATKSSLKAQILKANPTADTSKIDTLLSAAIGVSVVIGLVFVVLYVLLALQVRNGRNWARIVTWVVAGLGVLSGLASMMQPAPALTRVLTLIAVVLDIAVIVLLAQRPSGAYFKPAA